MSQTNTEIEINKTIKIRPKKANKKNVVVEEPPVVELNDFVEEEVVEEVVEEDIDVKIQLTEEQLKELHKEKKRKIARENIVEIRNARINVLDTELTRIQNEIKKLNECSIQVQLEMLDVEKKNQDELLIELYIQENTKIKKEKKQSTNEGTGKKAGTGNKRLQEIEDMNAGKMTDKLTHSKLVNGRLWSILFEGRKSDGGMPVYKCVNTNEYFMPLFKDVAGLIGENIKTKEDYFEWVKN